MSYTPGEALMFPVLYRLIRATGKKHRTVLDKTSNVLVTSPDPKDYEPYTFRYSYDAVGNFTTNQEYKSGTNNLNYKSGRIDLFNGDATEAGTFTDPTLGNFTYDANGNSTKTPRLAGLRHTVDNQCRWVDLGGGGQVRYLRHADQRVVRFVNKGGGSRALGVYLGPWEYHQRQGSTAYSKLVLHVEGHGRVAQAEKVITGTDPDSLPIVYLHGDHLGSAQVLTKGDGTLLSQEEYFPHGRPSDRRDARNRYRFIGVERDEETGLSMTGPRTYDPISGRFLQGDPVVAPGSPYAYCQGYATRLVDPTGYAPGDGLTDPGGSPALAPEPLGRTSDQLPPASPSAALLPDYPTSTVTVDTILDPIAHEAQFVTAPPGEKQRLAAVVNGTHLNPNDASTDSPSNPFNYFVSYGQLERAGMQADCGTAVRDSCYNMGYRIGGAQDNLFYDPSYDGPRASRGPAVEAGHKAFLPPNDARALLDYVDQALYEGKPVMAYVNYKAGPADGRVFDHVLYIIGRDYDEAGRVYYTALDNAISDPDVALQRIYVLATGDMVKLGDPQWITNSAHGNYTVINAREMR